MEKKNVIALLFAITVVLTSIFIGDGIRAQDTGQATTPVAEVKEIKLANGVAQGVMIYQANGKPLSVTIRANRGVIVCSHFDLKALESHNIAAASVQGIKSIDEALESKVVHVNSLAEKLGVVPGMSVREALGKMM
jgi:uncharacterized protein YunC (DUF1805 family)